MQSVQIRSRIIDARHLIMHIVADRLVELSLRLTDLGIHFYITEHTRKIEPQNASVRVLNI